MRGSDGGNVEESSDKRVSLFINISEKSFVVIKTVGQR